MIFFGANDGMIHAVDARTGYEVWAFIPYNLLPKLRTLGDGQPVEQFDYFVDSSPKLAEVKINGDWRSILLIGQGNGGTFYQAFDVTEGRHGRPARIGRPDGRQQLLSEFDTPNESIAFKWAFPNYSSFDPTYTAVFTVTDGTPGGKVKIYGDVKSSAALCREDGRLHLVRPRRRSAELRPLDQRRHRRVGLFPGHREPHPQPGRERAESRERDVPDRRGHRRAGRQSIRFGLRRHRVVSSSATSRRTAGRTRSRPTRRQPATTAASPSTRPSSATSTGSTGASISLRRGRFRRPR